MDSVGCNKQANKQINGQHMKGRDHQLAPAKWRGKLGGRYRQDTVFTCIKLKTNKEKILFLNRHALGITMKRVLDLLWARLEEDKDGKEKNFLSLMQI